eukprot:SAG11_NODE_2023_length_3910_cov_3.261349_2_plen_133_part_00
MEGGPAHELDHEVAVAHSVERVARAAREAEGLRQRRAVDAEDVARQRAAPERHHVDALSQLREPAVARRTARGGLERPVGRAAVWGAGTAAAAGWPRNFRISPPPRSQPLFAYQPPPPYTHTHTRPAQPTGE